MSDLPRFTGPAQLRQRMRLAAAVGMLAIAAIATGGLASLAAGRPMLSRRESRPSIPAWRSVDPIKLLDPASRLEQRVREAESASARARAGLRSARKSESVDPALLTELEQRLEHVGESPLDSIRRSYGGSPPPEPRNEQGRAHLRAIAPAVRDL